MYFYGNVFLSPNSYQFNSGGDGIKNYFTYAWHIRHDTSALGFQGMLHPYGEHLFFTDAQPGLSIPLQTLNNLFPGISNYSVGILNMLMLLAFPVAMVFQFLVLRIFGMKDLLAAVASVAIICLAPQVFRLTGHYALSYACFIPMTWYLWLRHRQEPDSRKWQILLFFNNSFWFWIHAYLGVMGVAFQLGYWIVWVWRKEVWVWARVWRELGRMFVLVLLPLVIFQIVAKTTDTITDRTDNPYGFFSYFAEPDDVFVPHHPPIRPLLDQLMPGVIGLHWEAWSYVGLSTTLTLLAISHCTLLPSDEHG